MYTRPLRNIIRGGRLTILLPVGLMLILLAYLSGIRTQNDLDDTLDRADSRDMLAYVSEEDRLMLYDPYDRTETTLLENVSSFVLGRDGRIAFTKLDETDTNLYIFDPAMPALAPINISQNPTANHYPLAWSPDGRYLAFASFEITNEYSHIGIYQGSYLASSRDQYIYVWDGETTTNIMPGNGLDTASRFYIDWSHDGRLAFTIQHGLSNRDVPPEIYLWDDSTTINVSQNPKGFDSAARWSRTGQLMFASSRDEGSNIYIWDGVSFRDGSPDTDSFIRLPPELEPSSPTWTDDGMVAFIVYPDSSPSGTRVIMLWDIEAETILRRYPIVSDNADSMFAEGGQVILSWHLASGTPSYYLDVENTEGEIVFSEHVGEFSWSSVGYLAYCRRERDYRDWIVSLWDGKDAWDVARTSYRPVQWQNGRSTFSCNNG